MESLFSAVSLLALGFVLGLQHALEADHVAAVSTIAQHKNIKKSSLLGAFWGIGHTATLLLIGMIVLSFKLVIPEKFALSFEFLVGVMLIVLGINLLLKFKKDNIHVHEHQHDDARHIHLHSHKESESHSHAHKSILVGALHGLAGSGAMMLIVSGATNNVISGMLFITIFGIGSILGMAATSAVITLPIVYSNRIGKADQIVKFSAGILSITIGAILVYEIGFAQHLLF
jgi:high-affinity nickel permease